MRDRGDGSAMDFTTLRTAHQMPCTPCFLRYSSCTPELLAISTLEHVEDVRLVCLFVARIAGPDDWPSLFISHMCHSGTVTTFPSYHGLQKKKIEEAVQSKKKEKS